MMPWHCTGSFSEQKANGHELVFHAGAQNFGGLAEDARNLVQARDVVFVVLDGIERNGERQIGEAGVDAVLLVDRHLVFFEVEIGDALLEDANEQSRGRVGPDRRSRWWGSPRSRARKIAVGLVALGNGGE